jgi:hypothetical protein
MKAFVVRTYVFLEVKSSGGMNANSVPDTSASPIVEKSELIRELELNQGSAMWKSRARCGIAKGETLLSVISQRQRFL